MSVQETAARMLSMRGTHSDGRSTSVMPASSFRNERDEVVATSCGAPHTPKRVRGQNYARLVFASRLDSRDDRAGVGQQECARLDLQVQLAAFTCRERRRRAPTTPAMFARHARAPSGPSRSRTRRTHPSLAHPQPPDRCSVLPKHHQRGSGRRVVALVRTFSYAMRPTL